MSSNLPRKRTKGLEDADADVGVSVQRHPAANHQDERSGNENIDASHMDEEPKDGKQPPDSIHKHHVVDDDKSEKSKLSHFRASRPRAVPVMASDQTESDRMASKHDVPPKSWKKQEKEDQKKSGLALMRDSSHPGATPVMASDQTESNLTATNHDLPPKVWTKQEKEDQKKKSGLALMQASHPGATPVMASDQTESDLTASDHSVPPKSSETQEKEDQKKKSGLALMRASQPGDASITISDHMTSGLPETQYDMQYPPPPQHGSNVEEQDNINIANVPNEEGANSLQVVAELVGDEEKDAASYVAQQVEELLATELELLQQERNQNQVVHQVAILEAGGDAKVGQNDQAKHICGLKPSICGVLLVILLGVGGALAAVLSGGKEGGTTAPSDPPTSAPTSEPTSTPTAAPDPRREYLLRVLHENVPTTFIPEGWQALLDDPFSPQGQALTWILEEDTFSETQVSISPQVLLERFALAVLYFSTSGPEWTLDFPYLDGSSSSCTWNSEDGGTVDVNSIGVYCTDGSNFDQVTVLKLDELRLRGTIPWEVSLLSGLQTLFLRGNLLSGTIPTQVSELSSLLSFWLSSNSLVGQVPPKLPATLLSLRLDDNALSGTLISDWAKSLSSLLSLELGRNQFHGVIPTEFGPDFGQLTWLDLQKNALSGSIPTELGWLSSVKGIYVNDNVLSGTLPSEFGTLSALQQLGIHENEALRGTIPTEFGGLQQLDRFYFYDTALTGSVDSIFCSTNRLSFLQGDCLGTSPEITCSCCDLCCMEDGNFCEYL